MIIFNTWKCGCKSQWHLSTDKDSEQYQVEKALIASDVTNHHATCKEFAKLCGVKYQEVGHGF